MLLKENKLKPTTNKQLLWRVRSNFVEKGTSLHAYCKQNNIHRGNAEKALLGTWSTKGGKDLKKLLIQASKAKVSTTK